MIKIAEDFHLECIGDDDEFWEDLVEPIPMQVGIPLRSEGGIGDSILDLSRSDCGFTCPYPELSVKNVSAIQSVIFHQDQESCEFKDPRLTLEELKERCFAEAREEITSVSDEFEQFKNAFNDEKQLR